MGDSLKLPVLGGPFMGTLLVDGSRPKWRSNFFRTCLCSVCEFGRQPKITISVRTSYGKVVGSRVKAKMAIEFLPYMPIQCM